MQWLDRHRGLTRYRYDATSRITRSQIGLFKDWGSAGVHSDAPGNTTGYPMAANEQFHWDAASNPLPTKPESPAGNADSFVPGNRLLVWQDARYEYDVHGNLIEQLQGKRGSAAQTRTRFTWDAAHQLVRTEVLRGPGEAAKIQSFTYAYDALGRRVAKIDAFGTTYFAYEGDRMAVEQRGGHEITYLYQPETFVPLAQVHDGTVHHLHTDHLGTPLEASNDGGEITWRVTYRAWGNVVAEEVTEIQQRVRFQGQYFDAETGLHCNRLRYYNSTLGRFTSQDPIGLLGGPNVFAYAPNPIGWIDPFGLSCVSRCHASILEQLSWSKSATAHVPSKAEAEELLRGLTTGPGMPAAYRDTTTQIRVRAGNSDWTPHGGANEKAGTYHWDKEDKNADSNDHACLGNHLQIHTFSGKIIRIFHP